MLSKHIRSFLGTLPGVRGAYGAVLRRRKTARFRQEFAKFSRMLGTEPRLVMPWRDRYPCLDECTPTTWFEPHYTYHPAWAARVLARTRPTLHVDIASSLHFCSLVSAFIPVAFYDYRPAALHLEGLECGQADLTQLAFANNQIKSLSCMHVVEHIGLGRYGDPLDPDGDLKAMRELQRVLAPGGDLLFVVPVGRPRICFNAHRVYSYESVRKEFAGLHLIEFALLPDEFVTRGLLKNATEQLVARQEYGCGCFWFRK